jgi:AraC family transcriptional regulator
MQTRHSIELGSDSSPPVSPGLQRSPLLTSQVGGWSGIYLEYHHRPPYKKPETASHQHLIHVTTDAYPGGCIMDGHLIHQITGTEDITVVPANLPCQCWGDTHCTFVNLVLEPPQLSYAIWEIVDPDRVELMPVFLQPDPLIHQIALALKTKLETDDMGSGLYAETMVNALAVHLLKRYTTQKFLVQNSSGGLSKVKLNQVVDYINESLDQELCLDELAALVHMSPAYFARLFKLALGTSPHQYVIQQRVKRAKEMLLKTDLAKLARRLRRSQILPYKWVSLVKVT